MIGVNDNCRVYGITCDRKKEDQVRCLIDNTIRNFQPHVSPHLYVIDFIPVKLTENEKVLDSIDPLLKVLEVSVYEPPNNPNSLYENDKGQVFVRRDGSVEGPLKTSQIVEWCRSKFTSNGNANRENHNNINSTLERLESNVKHSGETLKEIQELHEKMLRDWKENINVPQQNLRCTHNCESLQSKCRIL